jgi:hypothetical protein
MPPSFFYVWKIGGVAVSSRGFFGMAVSPSDL